MRQNEEGKQSDKAAIRGSALTHNLLLATEKTEISNGGGFSVVFGEL